MFDYGIRARADDQIAERLHCSQSTITRLKRKAKRNGAYQEWVNSTIDWSGEELRELHETIKRIDPVKAYEQMGRIIERSLTRRVEQKTEATIQANVQNHVDVDLNLLSEAENVEFTNLITKLFKGSVGAEGS